MEITDISVVKLGVELETPIENSRATLEQRETAIIKIETDEGITGIGEGYGPNPHIVETTVNQSFKQHLIGKNPLDVEQRWRDMVFSGGYFDQKGHLISAASGIDIALWDLIGKYYETPIYRLLGGSTHQSAQLKAYANLLTWDEPRAMAKYAKEYERRGFDAVKIHIGRGIDADEARVRAIQSTLDDAELMVDANCGYTMAEAVEVGRMLEEYGVLWYEEPIPPHRSDDYGSLGQTLDVPIASGENEFTKWGFKELFSVNGTDFATPSVSRCGGITELNKICALAEAFGVTVSPNTFPTGISLAAVIHVMVSSPACEWLEWDTTDFPLFGELFTESIGVDDDGFVDIPTAPGLGVKLGSEDVDRYRIE